MWSGGVLSYKASHHEPPILKPGSLGSIGESSVLVPECELDPEMWRKGVGKQPLKVMQFDKIGKEQCLGERTSLIPSSALQHSLAYRKAGRNDQCSCEGWASALSGK